MKIPETKFVSLSLWAIATLQDLPAMAQVIAIPSGFGYFLDPFTVGIKGRPVQVHPSLAIIGNTDSTASHHGRHQGLRRGQQNHPRTARYIRRTRNKDAKITTVVTFFDKPASLNHRFT
jgi:hypothetical protein